ncbi:geranylgeranylglyceryl/heptaprenylglyceryl phosphate synthase [bacterium]|nr:geranylgeranylglyceryl/heptaprenylglyceryl phosphate synthase [bacterium]
MSSVLDILIKGIKKHGAGYVVLIDPESGSREKLINTAQKSCESGADVIFIGGSLVSAGQLDLLISEIKQRVDIPVVLFPGGAYQISKEADAILFMSLISGRNPQFLIGEQVYSAPIIKKTGLETIPTGYMLIESGKITSVEFMSNTKPIPSDKPDIAAAHALAAQFLGMKMIYLEAGSGALKPVPDKVVSNVCKSVSIPVIVGGGIRDPKQAETKVKMGASFIVTGTVIEDNGTNMIKEFADAVHSAGKELIK